MTSKAYKVNFTLLFDVPTDPDTSGIVSAINQLFLDIDKSLTIAYIPLNETDVAVTALITLDIDQQAPEYWIPQLIHRNLLMGDTAMNEFKSIEISADQVDAEQKAIFSAYLKSNANK